MKRFLLALSLLLSCSGMLSAESNPLVIITYNIHHGQGTDNMIDLERIASIIRGLNPDIVCLQEVDRNLPRTDHVDMPRVFAEKLGMNVVFEPNYQFDGGDYGNATFTRLPIVKSRNVVLPNPVSAEPRGCLIVTVEWQNKQIDVMNTHLGLNGQERLAQAEAIIAELSDCPVILTGDMNENATAPGMKILSKHLGDSFDATTATTRATIPADAPIRRIDYIFLSKHWKALSSLITHDDVTRVASDHLPYRAIVHLNSE